MYTKSILAALTALLAVSLATPVPKSSEAADLAALDAQQGKPTNLPKDSIVLQNGQGVCFSVQGIAECSDSSGASLQKRKKNAAKNSAAADLAALRAVNRKPTNLPKDSIVLQNGQGVCFSVQGIAICSDSEGGTL